MGVQRRSTRAKGVRFVYVKETGSTTYRVPAFGRRDNGSRAAGLVRTDGWTLPPALGIEYDPYGCTTTRRRLGPAG
ncbi:hypothetical protein ACFU3E_13715 [Streptomyces sp. NPDC057424]|uniref:hypothetical protein n=1 Tax=Streptomyces sp. NPDC057424 TaxID=3346127 RepID=UPI0036CBBB9E